MGGETAGEIAYVSPYQLINSEFSWWKDDYQEFYFNLNKSRMAQADILPIDLFASIRPVFGKDIYAGTIVVDNETEKLKLSSRQSKEFDIWSMQYVPQTDSESKPAIQALPAI